MARTIDAETLLPPQRQSERWCTSVLIYIPSTLQGTLDAGYPQDIISCCVMGGMGSTLKLRLMCLPYGALGLHLAE
jgi:hypothetical protein